MITTMLEHNSVLRPLYEMEKKGVLLTIVKSNEMGTLRSKISRRKSGRDEDDYLYEWLQSDR